jgi:hypothetical protein
LVPVTVIEEIASEAVPEFESVKGAEGAVEPTLVLAKVYALGVSAAAGAIPVQLRPAICCGIGEGKLTASVAVRAPLVVGEQVTAMEQEAPAARLEPQALVCANPAALAFTMVTLSMDSAWLPVLLRVAEMAALVVPAGTLPKSIVEGVSNGTGPVPTQLRATLCDGNDEKPTTS